MESATIGKAAGEMWAYLDARGTVSLPQLQKGTHLSARLLAMGLGWLAREGKLAFVQERPVLKLCLQDEQPG
jgi:winged helix-turn-helix protein DUF2582